LAGHSPPRPADRRRGRARPPARLQPHDQTEPAQLGQAALDRRPTEGDPSEQLIEGGRLAAESPQHVPAARVEGGNPGREPLRIDHRLVQLARAPE
jgi:hypothetical protein